jgi:electron transport complex protein RnfB
VKRDAVALVDEAHCIGCVRCIEACPVDAIVGAAQQMHTVVEDWCIGCGLCLPPCPVDCIAMVPARAPWTLELKQAAKQRAVERRSRFSKNIFDAKVTDRKAVIAAALARKKRA